MKIPEKLQILAIISIIKLINSDLLRFLGHQLSRLNIFVQKPCNRYEGKKSINIVINMEGLGNLLGILSLVGDSKGKENVMTDPILLNLLLIEINFIEQLRHSYLFLLIRNICLAVS